MSKLIDLTGQRFGRLVVLEKDNERKTNCGSYWKCQCDCGKIKSIRSSSLRNGDIVSCGCYRIEQVMKAKEANGTVDNLIGKRFGLLTVIEKDPIRAKDGAVKWICQCDCGNKVSVQGNNLKRTDGNNTISCGCAHTPLGEIYIKGILDENNINYAQQYGFKDLPRKHYDFALLNENQQPIRLIEFDGEFHYKELPDKWDGNLKIVQQRDQEKNQYAKEHNIPLVRIPYWERENITLDIILGNKYLME